MTLLKRSAAVARRLGSSVRLGDSLRSRLDIEPDARRIIETVRPYTMTSPERIYALIQAVKYVVRGRIEGDIVECGVWRGGSMMAVAQTLLSLNETNRHLYLFDTFEGMPEPSEQDVDVHGRRASLLLRAGRRTRDSTRAFESQESVRANLATIRYPQDCIEFVKGKVEDTVPGQAPAVISLLRLDTDWYESTRHELAHLYPRLSSGGVLIIDDYGHWQGARRAVDEYVSEHNVAVLLNRIDYTGRIGVKPYAQRR